MSARAWLTGGAALSFAALVAFVAFVAIGWGSDEMRSLEPKPGGATPAAAPLAALWDWGRALRSAERAARPVVEPQRTTPGPGSSAALLRSWGTPTNWRPVAADALRHPEIGGAFYAERMLSFCRGVDLAALAASISAKDERQSRSLQELKGRCSDFVASDFGATAEARILGDNRQKDPLVRAAAAFAEARDALSADTASIERLRRAIDAVMASQDPLLIDAIGLRLVAYQDAATGWMEYRFDGAAYPLNAEPDFGLAMLLAPCHLGLVCDAAEPRALVRCAQSRWCEGGRFEEVKAALAGVPGGYEKVLALSAQVAAAIQARDAARFMPR